jgi:hypothetical protein
MISSQFAGLACGAASFSSRAKIVGGPTDFGKRGKKVGYPPSGTRGASDAANFGAVSCSPISLGVWCRCFLMPDQATSAKATGCTLVWVTGQLVIEKIGVHFAMQLFMNLFQRRNLIFCARACFLQLDHFLLPSSSAIRDFSAPLSTKGEGAKTE